MSPFLLGFWIALGVFVAVALVCLAAWLVLIVANVVLNGGAIAQEYLRRRRDRINGDRIDREWHQ